MAPDTAVMEPSPGSATGLTRKATSLFEPAIVRRAIIDSFKRLNPRTDHLHEVLGLVGRPVDFV